MSAEIFAAGQNVPGAKLYKNRLFQTPVFAGFAYVLSIVPLGTAKAAVEQFTKGMRQRAGTYTGVRVAELTSVQAKRGGLRSGNIIATRPWKLGKLARNSGRLLPAALSRAP